MVKESSKDWWDEAHKRLENIQDKFQNNVISHDQAIIELEELLEEIIITEKLEGASKEEKFQYKGIKLWIKNVIDFIKNQNKTDEN